MQYCSYQIATKMQKLTTITNYRAYNYLSSMPTSLS